MISPHVARRFQKLCVYTKVKSLSLSMEQVFQLPSRSVTNKNTTTPALKRKREDDPQPLFVLPPRNVNPPTTADQSSNPLLALPPRITSDPLLALPPRKENPTTIHFESNTPPTVVQSIVSIPARPQRHTWDKGQIDKLARSSEVYEKLFGANLQTWLGSEYVVQPHQNKFNRHDFFLFKKSNPSKQVGIELECGVTQDQWTQHIHDNRKRWVQGLNVVSRKIVEGQHFDVFIKHNKSCNSFFAATYDFIKQNGKIVIQTQNSLKFKTDNTIYALPWALIEEESHADFVTDDPEKLKTLLDTFLV